MKIAYIALRGVPLSDGIVQYTDDISRELVKRGHEVTVYTSTRYGNKSGIYDDSYKIITVPSLPWGFAEKLSLVFFASVHQLFKKYDVVHYHAMGPSIFSFMSHGKATVIQSHGIEYDRAKYGSIARNVLQILEKWSVKLGDELLVCSSALHEHFINTYGKESIVIHNSVNIPESLEADPTILKQYGVDPQKYYLYIARITKEKGLGYLINAFKMLKTNKKLIIAGPFDAENNPYHKELKQMAEDDDRISFVGVASGKNKESLLQGAYAYCLPSELEGFSIALLEAMSYGKCCVISDIPCNLEATAGSAIVFESKNENALYEALRKAEMFPEQARIFGDSARQRVIDHFSEDMLVQKTEKFYTEILERKKQKRRKGNEETRRIQEAVDNVASCIYATGEDCGISKKETGVL